MKEKKNNIRKTRSGLQRMENIPEACSVRISWKKIAFIDLLLIALLVLSTRFATFLHEVFGHTLVAILTGGEVHKIKISLFGGGMVWADLGSYHLGAVILYWYAGILVNLITGALPICFVEKIKNANFVWALFWAVFAMMSLLGALAYLVLGLYYDFGDPVNWVRVTPRWLELSWIPFLIAAPFAAHICARLYISVQQRMIPTRNLIGCLKILFATLGVSLFVYTGLFWLTGQSLASADAPVVAYQREATKIIEKKKKELAQQIRTGHPELTEDEIQSRVGNTSIHVQPNEVPLKFPMVPVLAFLFLTGGLTALKKREIDAEGSLVQPKAVTVFLLFLLAAIVILALGLRDETVYERNRQNDRHGLMRMEPGKLHFRMQGEGVSRTVARVSISISGMSRFAEPALSSGRL
jgi:hypothetical protein